MKIMNVIKDLLKEKKERTEARKDLSEFFDNSDGYKVKKITDTRGVIIREHCSICNNGLREERQYGCLKISDDTFILLDAEEFAYLEEREENRKKGNDTIFQEVEPEDQQEVMLVYGVLIPQAGSTITIKEWGDEIMKYKNFAFSTLHDNKEFLSTFKEIKLFENDVVYENQIPCAMLLQTALNLDEKKGYGFGYTMFLKYANLNIFENIFNRPFVFCIRDIEKNYLENMDNWYECVNFKLLKQTALELF